MFDRWVLFGYDDVFRLLRDPAMSVDDAKIDTLHDVEFGTRTIPKGTFVLAGLASANHDPAKWGPTADDLDLTRDGTGQHLAFGSGAPFCLGSSPAKLEAQVAIGSFVRRFPKARVVAEPEWNGRINLRDLQRLDVAVG